MREHPGLLAGQTPHDSFGSKSSGPNIHSRVQEHKKCLQQLKKYERKDGNAGMIHYRIVQINRFIR